MQLIGRISHWQRGRGFGYLDCEGRKVFLHIRDFKERHKQPEAGDVIHFVMGADGQGRPCALQAVHANDGGRLRPVDLLFLGFLVLPGFAVHRLFGLEALAYAGVWVAVFSGATFLAYASDKRQARTKGWRQAESILHLWELLGGWPGAFFAQRFLRHKASKGSYLIGFALIVALYQFLAIDALRCWPIARLLFQGLHRLG